MPRPDASGWTQSSGDAPTTLAVLTNHTVVVGDLGSGKSTLLTAMSGGRARFQSGLSFGSGLTNRLQTVVVDGQRYSDTPGMDDQEMRRQAIKAISGAFQLGGVVKMVLVLTLEAGRLRISNLVTMRAVLDALAANGVRVDGSFSVIINKMSPADLDAWDDAARPGRALLQQHLGAAHALGPLLCLPLDERIPNAETGELPHDLLQPVFLFGACAPGMFIPPGTRVWVPSQGPPSLSEAVEEARAPREQRQRGHTPHASLQGTGEPPRGAGGSLSLPQRQPVARQPPRSASLDGAPRVTGCLQLFGRPRDAPRSDHSGRTSRRAPARGRAEGRR